MNQGRSALSNKQDLVGTSSSSRLDLERSRLLLEQENDNHLVELHSKLSSLKDIAIDIDGEVKNQNRYLDDMGNDMSRANSGMKLTLNKVGKLLSNADQPTLVVIVLVIVLIFILLWKLLFSKK